VSNKPTLDDVLGAIGKSVGVDHKAIMVDVRANLAKLNACPRHDFQGIQDTSLGTLGDGSKWFRDYRCTRCGGKVDSHGYHWYQRGVEHGSAK
jgi:hypothetical protein